MGQKLSSEVQKRGKRRMGRWCWGSCIVLFLEAYANKCLEQTQTNDTRERTWIANSWSPITNCWYFTTDCTTYSDDPPTTFDCDYVTSGPSRQTGPLSYYATLEQLKRPNLAKMKNVSPALQTTFYGLTTRQIRRKEKRDSYRMRHRQNCG